VHGSYSLNTTASVGVWLYPNATDEGQIGRSDILFRAGFFTRSIQGSKSKTLTDNGLVAFVKIAVPADDYAGGDVIYTLYCKDAADQVTRTGRVAFSAQAKTTTSACPATLTTYGYNAADISNNAKTFTTVAFTCLGSATAGNNLIQLQVQADCSITTPTSMTIEYRLDMPHPQTVTPQ
jgi:hypothetical protein